LGRENATAKRKKVDVEPYRRRVRGIMHSLDRMRASEAYWHVGGLTDELRGVEKTAMANDQTDGRVAMEETEAKTNGIAGKGLP
jgi:hypothetical protein